MKGNVKIEIMLREIRKRNPHSGAWLETHSVHDNTPEQTQVSLPAGLWSLAHIITCHLRLFGVPVKQKTVNLNI